MKKLKSPLNKISKQPSLAKPAIKISKKALIDARLNRHDEEIIALRSKIAELEEAVGTAMQNITRFLDYSSLDVEHEKSSGDMASRIAHLDSKPVNTAAAKGFVEYDTFHANSKVLRRIKAVTKA
jgi:hypothetical protein